MMNDKPEAEPEWLITDPQWEEISKHPSVHPEDRHHLDLIVIMSRYMLRYPKINYEEIRTELRKARRSEEVSRYWLRIIIKNDNLFSAISAEFDLLQAVGFFESNKITPKQIPQRMETELESKERLLQIYDLIKLRLGGIGRKGDEALSLLIRHLNTLIYIRTGKPLSRSNEDICLVSQLYKIGACRSIATKTVSNRIKEENENWDADVTNKMIADVDSTINFESPLRDAELLALIHKWVK
jgi:hypothetical protein